MLQEGPPVGGPSRNPDPKPAPSRHATWMLGFKTFSWRRSVFYRPSSATLRPKTWLFEAFDASMIQDIRSHDHSWPGHVRDTAASWRRSTLQSKSLGLPGRLRIDKLTALAVVSAAYYYTGHWRKNQFSKCQRSVVKRDYFPPSTSSRVFKAFSIYAIQPPPPSWLSRFRPAGRNNHDDREPEARRRASAQALL
jgi:hypothetical protein